jgi:hypothetical protein
VACVSGSSGTATSCKASVNRLANTIATVVVTNLEGQKQQFLFVRSKAVAPDQPEMLSVQRRGSVSCCCTGRT